MKTTIKILCLIITLLCEVKSLAQSYPMYNEDDYPRIINAFLNSKYFSSVYSDSIDYVKVEEENIVRWYNLKNSSISYMADYSDTPNCRYLIIQILPSVVYGESKAIIIFMPENNKYETRISKSYCFQYMFEYDGDYNADYNQITTYQKTYETIINTIINSEQFNLNYKHPQVVFIENEMMPIPNKLTFTRNGIDAVIKKSSEIGIFIGDFTTDIENPQTARVQFFMSNKLLNFRLELKDKKWEIVAFNVMNK